jgi:hypothetical protein
MVSAHEAPLQVKKRYRRTRLEACRVGIGRVQERFSAILHVGLIETIADCGSVNFSSHFSRRVFNVDLIFKYGVHAQRINPVGWIIIRVCIAIEAPRGVKS